MSALVLIFTPLLMSFTFLEKEKEKEKEKIEKSESTDQNSWGVWKTSTCFIHLKYRIKKKSYGEWAINFKNGYNKSISMSVGIKEGFGGDRFTVPSGNSRIHSGYYTNNKQATYLNFTVSRVKFGDTSWGGPYAGCD